MVKYYHGSVRESPWYNEQNWKQFLGKELKFLNHTRGNPTNQKLGNLGNSYTVPVPGRPWDGSPQPEEFCPRSTKAANQYWETMKSLKVSDTSRLHVGNPKSAPAESFRSRESEHCKHAKQSAVDRLLRSADANKLPSQRSIHTALPESRKLFPCGETPRDHGIKFSGRDHIRARSTWYATLTSFPKVSGIDSEKVQKDWRRQTAPNGCPRITARSSINTPKAPPSRRLTKEVKGYLDTFNATSFSQLCARPCTRACDRVQGEQTLMLIQAAGRA